MPVEHAAVARAAHSLGEYLAGWRKILGLTAEQVADRAGISRTTLRKIEHGDAGVRFGAVLSVARSLGVLDRIIESADPLASDLGRARASLLNRRRVR